MVTKYIPSYSQEDKLYYLNHYSKMCHVCCTLWKKSQNAWAWPKLQNVSPAAAKTMSICYYVCLSDESLLPLLYNNANRLIEYQQCFNLFNKYLQDGSYIDYWLRLLAVGIFYTDDVLMIVRLCNYICNQAHKTDTSCCRRSYSLNHIFTSELA